MTDPTEQARSQKPPLSRVNLEQHGIFFDTAILPIKLDDDRYFEHHPHVDSLRLALLNFGTTIQRDHKADLEKECEAYLKRLKEVSARPRRGRPRRVDEIPRRFSQAPPDDAYAPQPTWSGELRTRDVKISNINEHLEAARDARERKGERQNEFAWTFYLLTHIFQRYRQAIQDVTQDSNLFDQWRLEVDVCWLDHASVADADGSKLSSPKPDLTYAYPIFKDEDDLPPGLKDLDCAKNFHLDYLIQLRQPARNGTFIRSSLNRGLFHASVGKSKIEELSSYELMCFPWAVVEVKKPDIAGGDVDKCYCQAANGSAVALRIFQSVFMKAYGAIPNDLPPIVAFTCIGPILRVWLAYADDTSEPGQKMIMRCIFATSLELRWGVMAAREIVKNMHVWASRVLKPRISAALSTIRTKQASNPSDSNPQVHVEFEAYSGTNPTRDDDPEVNRPSLLRRLTTMTLGSSTKLPVDTKTKIRTWLRMTPDNHRNDKQTFNTARGVEGRPAAVSFLEDQVAKSNPVEPGPSTSTAFLGNNAPPNLLDRNENLLRSTVSAPPREEAQDLSAAVENTSLQSRSIRKIRNSFSKLTNSAIMTGTQREPAPPLARPAIAQLPPRFGSFAPNHYNFEFAAASIPAPTGRVLDPTESDFVATPSRSMENLDDPSLGTINQGVYESRTATKDFVDGHEATVAVAPPGVKQISNHGAQTPSSGEPTSEALQTEDFEDGDTISTTSAGETNVSEWVPPETGSLKSLSTDGAYYDRGVSKELDDLDVTPLASRKRDYHLHGTTDDDPSSSTGSSKVRDGKGRKESGEDVDDEDEDEDEERNEEDEEGDEDDSDEAEGDEEEGDEDGAGSDSAGDLTPRPTHQRY